MSHRDQTAEKNPNRRHGMYKTAVYRRWVYMKTRCAKDPHYLKHGITVCSEWATNFMQFYTDMGDVPFEGATLDRIDGTKGYSKDNCRWATYSEQNRNLLYRDGRKKPRADLAAALDLHRNTLAYREKHGIATDAPKYGAHTHCPNGHEYTEANTRIAKNGIRKCRKCHNATQNRAKQKRLALLRGLNPKRSE